MRRMLVRSVVPGVNARVRRGHLRVPAVASLAVAMVAAAAGVVAPASASHGGFTVSTGIYRIPYADGTQVTVGGDHHSHNPPDRIDLNAGMGTPVVAAASGIIRAIVDFNGNSPNPGDGQDINGNPQDDSLEHSCQDGNPAVPNSVVVGLCQNYNNYVWIEHPNGEWTKYTHFGTGTVTAPPPNGFGWAVDMPIQAGQVLGVEGDVGRASGSHLHHEVAVQNGPGPLTFTTLGGFITNGTNLVPFVCDIGGATPNFYFDPDADNDGVDDNGLADPPYTANPCNHQPPTADADGPYIVDEGGTVPLDGAGSNDPEGNPLTFLWAPDTNLDDPSLALPTFNAVDNGINFLTLTVYDQIEALSDSDVTSVTVNNVAPSVSAVGDAIDEGGTATVTATFTDPGAADTHTATIDWGDGTGAHNINPLQLGVGASHVYGDDGIFNVTVEVTDDDDGVGTDTVQVVVGNIDPTLTLDTAGTVGFPGGDYWVLEPGEELAASADGSDPGSDDLTFSWTTGDINTFFNNGIGPDPFLSPFGTFPFQASDQIDAAYGEPGAETLGVALTDDDGGLDHADGGVLVTGEADATQGRGWWKHEYSGNGAAHVDADTAAAYLAIVNAASSVFSEAVAATTAGEAHAVLSPSPADRRGQATAELLAAWLEFASGAVAWDATVPLSDGSQVAFLDLMAEAEEAILDQGTTAAELLVVEQDLARVRHAG